MYDELLEAWKTEKLNVEIQPLPRDFYVRLAEYIRKIREERRMLDEKTVKGSLMKKEEENVKKMAAELIQIRYEKIMSLIRRGEVVPASNLTDEEERWSQESSLQLDSFKKFTEKLLQGRLEKVEEKRNSGQMVVRLLRDIPEIVGADMKTYGPFKKEDIASLPKENAKVLIKQGAAVEIETAP
jgi:DNA replication factor GINS